MNRRELLAAGVGLGGMAVASSAVLACDAADKKPEKDAEELRGTTYCPLFQYMFCGSYTVYYAVTKVGNVCGTNAGVMSGPNGLPLGCPGNGCITARFTEMKIDGRAVTTPHVVHDYLQNRGMKVRPNKKLAFAPGVSLLDGTPEDGFLVKFMDDSPTPRPRYARVFIVGIDKASIDSEMLRDTEVDLGWINDLKSYVGHEDPKGNDPIDDDNAKGDRVGAHSFRVSAFLNGSDYEFLVIMNGPRP